MKELNSTPSRSSFSDLRRAVLRPVAVAYVVVLTVLLVHPDVFSLFGVGAKSAESQVDATVPGLLQHFCAYVLLGTVLHAGFAGPAWPGWRLLTFAMLHGSMTEAVQMLVPNRVADWWDLSVNLSGAVVSVAVCSWWARSRRTMSRIPELGDDACAVCMSPRTAAIRAETPIPLTLPVDAS